MAILASSASLTWTTGEMHTNREVMKETRFGDVILAGPIIVSCAVGQSQFVVRPITTAWGVEFVAALEFDKLRFYSPVIPGDTIYVETDISIGPAEVGRTSTCTCKETVYKQGNVKVCDFQRTSLVRRFKEAPDNM